MAESTTEGHELPSTHLFARGLPRHDFPENGIPARDAYELIHLGLKVDGQPSMNLASFVTTWMEPEAEMLIHEAISTNHIDHEEYPVAEWVEQIHEHVEEFFRRDARGQDRHRVAGLGVAVEVAAIALAGDDLQAERRADGVGQGEVAIAPDAQVGIEAPWRMDVQDERRVMPDAAYPVWRTLADQLSGRRFVGELPVADGVHCWFAQGHDSRDAALVAWTDQAIGVRLQVGA